MIARVLLIGALLGACGDDREDPPVTIEAHGVRVTVTPVPARIEVVRVADGEVIFDGSYGGPAGTSAPPHVAAAFRSATAEIETQTGAFKIEEDPVAPWQGVATFQQVRAEGLSIKFSLGGADGAIGSGAVVVSPVGGAGDGPPMVQILLETAPGAFNRASISYASPSGEHLLGLGGQSFDVDHRGQTVPLWVEEDGITKRDDDAYDGVWFLTGRRHATHTPMPIFVSSRGYAAAVNTNARAVFALASEGEDVIRLEAWEGRLDLRLFPGISFIDDAREELEESIASLTLFTRRPAVPDRVVFSTWIDALYGSDNVRRVAQALRDAGVAAGVIWTEDWRGGNDEGTGYVLEEDWRVDRDLYPDFEAVAADLATNGYQWLIYANTFLDESADVFDEAIDAGFTIHDDTGAPYLFTGVKFRDATLLDLTNPDAVVWAKQTFQEALELGADGWMADFGEWLPTDAVLASGEDAMLVHNRYPVDWAKFNFELARIFEMPRLRTYFMRAAWLGSQPYVQVIWAGDQQTDWSVGDGLQSVIPIGLGLGLTGFPYYGHDIGGYMSQLTEPTTKELWFRWCTLGAMTPVMRTHHGRSARANWNWESDAETTAHLARWSQLHAQLADYQMRMAGIAHEQGLPIMRPVALGFPEAGDWAWTTTDEYLLGDRLLVAPVLTEGATSRVVRFPDGMWIPWLGGAAVSGEVEVDAPLSEIPVFAPAGAVLPLSGSVYVLYPGFAPPGSPWATDPRSFAGGVTVGWAGRDLSLPPPATAKLNGVDVALVRDGADLVVDVPDLGAESDVDFAGGGHVSIAANSACELRLRVP